MFLKSFEDHSLVITLRTGFVSLTLNKMSQNLSSLHLGLGLFHTASGAAARRQHRQWHASVSSLPQLYCSWWPSLYKESPTFTLTWHEFFFFSNVGRYLLSSSQACNYCSPWWPGAAMQWWCGQSAISLLLDRDLTVFTSSHRVLGWLDYWF